MDTIPNTQKRITRRPVCFHCGSEKNLKPYESYLWGTWHICRKCEIEAEKAKAKRGKRREAK